MAFAENTGHAPSCLSPKKVILAGIHGPTFIMVCLATFVLQASLYAGQERPWISLLEFAITLAVVAWGMNRWQPAGRPMQPRVVAMLVAAFAVPFVLDVVYRSTLAHGALLEVTLVNALRNVMWGLAVVPGRRECQRLACAASLFLVLFGFCAVFHWGTAALMFVYVLVGLWWLIGSHWEKLQAFFPAESRREIPRGASLTAVGGAAIIGAVMLVLVPSGRVGQVVKGFMPSSGGSSWSDPFATQGIGDGEQLIGGTDDASTFGPVETELFIDSQQPSLYDMFDDMYNPPLGKRKREQERTIALSSPRREPKQKMARSEKAGKSFSTARDAKPKQSKPLEDQKSRAMFYVSGRVPWHLPLQRFDRWDGETWTQSQDTEPDSHFTVSHRAGRPWLEVASEMSQSLTPRAEQHAVMYINLRSNRIPSPPGLARVHIDKIDQPDMFGWTADRVLCMNRDRVPSLTVVHLESYLAPRQARETWSATVTLASAGSAASDTPLSRLAREWTAGSSRGWPQVEAVCESLKSHCEFDPRSVASPEAEDTVEHFLLQSKRGPDYLFASSAALLLRQLGYQTRVVSGFYADPKERDRVSRLTAIYPSHLHFWTEVTFDGSTWFTVDATPGYDVLEPRRTLIEIAKAAASAALRWVARHPVFVTFWLAGAVAVFVFRRALLTRIAEFAWRTALWCTPRHAVSWTLWLLNVRARIRGRTRPAGCTLTNWLKSLHEGDDPHARRVIQAFLSLCQWSCYGGERVMPWTSEKVLRCCVSMEKLTRTAYGSGAADTRWNREIGVKKGGSLLENLSQDQERAWSGDRPQPDRPRMAGLLTVPR